MLCMQNRCEMVVCTETITPVVNWEDQNVCLRLLKTPVLHPTASVPARGFFNDYKSWELLLAFILNAFAYSLE